jgi:hypothetical protein
MKPTAVFSLLLGVLLIISVSNWVHFWNMQSAKDTETAFQDARFWELNYKIEFLVAVSAIVAAGLVYLGYDSLRSTKEQLKSEMEKEIVELREELTRTKADSDNVSKIVANSKGEVGNQLESLQKLEKKIDEINKKNIVQQGYYVISGLTVVLDTNQEVIQNGKIHFKDLTTTSGDKLPAFTSPPLVIAISEGDSGVDIYRVKPDSFEPYPTHTGIALSSSIKYSVVIIGR